MRIYNGWVLEIEGKEWTICGKIKVRNSYWVVLKNEDEKTSLIHKDIVSGLQSGDIKYIKSVAV